MRAFTAAQRAYIVAARNQGESWEALALKFRVDKRKIKAVVADMEAHPERLTPAPYALGYRTAVYKVRNVFSWRLQTMPVGD